jgi:hypothetical protein
MTNIHLRSQRPVGRQPHRLLFKDAPPWLPLGFLSKERKNHKGKKLPYPKPPDGGRDTADLYFPRVFPLSERNSKRKGTGVVPKTLTVG